MTSPARLRMPYWCERRIALENITETGGLASGFLILKLIYAILLGRSAEAKCGYPQYTFAYFKRKIVYSSAGVSSGWAFFCLRCKVLLSRRLSLGALKTSELVIDNYILTITQLSFSLFSAGESRFLSTFVSFVFLVRAWRR